MTFLPWSSGYRKVSHKVRRGRKKKNQPAAHKSHRKKLPSLHDRDHATERRQRLTELREADYDSEIE